MDDLHAVIDKDGLEIWPNLGQLSIFQRVFSPSHPSSFPLMKETFIPSHDDHQGSTISALYTLRNRWRLPMSWMSRTGVLKTQQIDHLNSSLFLL
jgi:hypothetical protein